LTVNCLRKINVRKCYVADMKRCDRVMATNYGMMAQAYYYMCDLLTVLTNRWW